MEYKELGLVDALILAELLYKNEIISTADLSLQDFITRLFDRFSEEDIVLLCDLAFVGNYELEDSEKLMDNLIDFIIKNNIPTLLQYYGSIQ